MMGFDFGYIGGMGFNKMFYPGLFFFNGIVGFLLLAFWIWMLVDCLLRNFDKKSNEKIIWVIVIIFAKVIGALIYFFIVKNRMSKKK